MNIVREDLKTRFLGESKAELVDENGDKIIETPTAEANLQEVRQKEEFNGIYKLGICLPNKAFNMNPFIDKRASISDEKDIEAGVLDFDKWLDKSQAFVSSFAPKYSSELKDYSAQNRYTREVSMRSKASFLTIPETPNITSTKRLIIKAKAKLKSEGKEKKILVQIGMNQDEEDFALMCKLGATKANGFIVEWENVRDRWYNLKAMAGYYGSKAIRILHNVPREYQRGGLLTTSATLADLVSHATITGWGRKDGKKQKKLTEVQRKKVEIIKALRFRRSDDSFGRYVDYRSDGITSMECDCEADQFAGDTIDDFIRTYNNYPYYATNVHNVCAIYQAIGDVRSHMSKGLINYFGLMPYARKVIEDVYHQNPWQARLKSKPSG